MRRHDTGASGDLVRLADAEPFGRGGNRLCYVDPRDDSRCIKVPIPGREAAAKRAAAPVWKRLRPIGYYDDNLREYASYRKIASHFGAAVWTHLPRCHGLVTTDLGLGIVTDLVRDPSGRVSVSLKTILREEGRSARFQAGLDDFVTYLRETCLPTRDLLLHNLVAQWDDSRTQLRFHVIDGFGSSDALPLVYWSRRLARAKVERKIARFHGKIDEFCAKYSIGATP